MDFTVDSRFESFLLGYLPLISVASLIFSFLAFYLLIKKTPKGSDRYKWYLLNLQFWSVLLDAHFVFFLAPIPLFPLVAGYCKGILCVVQLPMHYSLFILFILGSEVAYAVMLALLFRHQSVLPLSSNFKLKKRSTSLILISFQFVFLIPSISFLSSASQARSDRMHFAMMYPPLVWVTDNPEFVFYNNRSPLINFTVNFSGAGIVLFFAFCTAIIIHMFHHLHINKRLMSVKTLSVHNKLTIVITLQATSIAVVLILPILFHSISVITWAFPFEVCWVAYCIQLTFTIAHTSILIVMTPSYFTTILAWVNIHKNVHRQRFPRELRIATTKYEDRILTVY